MKNLINDIQQVLASVAQKVLPAILVLAMLFPIAASAAGKDSADAPDVDVKKIIFEHVKDAYEWHITTIGDKHVSIYLPIIVYSERTGWNSFSSGVFHHHDEYNGFSIARDGDNEGKIVEMAADGTMQRPMLDISITKTVLAVFLNAILLVVIVLSVASWYKRRGNKDSLEAPKGFVGAFEMMVDFVIEDIAKPNIGRNYARFLPYLLTAFFFIFLSNIMGIIPFFPGGSNVTGNIAVTMALAICTFIAVNLFGNREYWKEILWPDVPVWLKVPIPLMPFIEVFGMFVKPFALMIRLFANILAGHTVVLAFVCIIFVTMSVSMTIGSAMTFVSVLFTVFINFLELLVAFIQAFVFTMLSAVFIGMAQHEPHGHDTHE